MLITNHLQGPNEIHQAEGQRNKYSVGLPKFEHKMNVDISSEFVELHIESADEKFDCEDENIDKV